MTDGKKQRKPQKPRREWTPEEAREAQEQLQTVGKKGAKLPRINMAFTPSNHEYIRTLAQVKGTTMTEVINEIVTADRIKNAELYEQIKKIRESL